MTNIVSVSVSQQIASAPSTLQSTGALLSQGATNTSPGTKTLLTQLSSLTPLLNGSLPLTSLTQTGGTATATATSAHGFTTGDSLWLTIAGATPAAYNGNFLCTITTTTAFTYKVPTGTAGTATGTLIYTVEDVAELLAMATTFFAQGSIVPIYVLELGAGNPSDGVAYLTSWLTANPGFFYDFCVPRTWDANTNFLTLIQSFESPTSKTYFWVTTTLNTYTSYTALMKDVHALIEAPAYGVWSANVLTALSQGGAGTVTATTTTAHGVAIGQWFQISGMTPTGYNGWWQAADGTTGSTLIWQAPAGIGAESVLGTLVVSPYASTGITATEFSIAAQMWVQLNYNPSSTNKVTPFNYSYLYGVTPFPVQGNSALITTLRNANISLIGTGSEGGISLALIDGGNMMDGNPLNYWYSVDYAQINCALALAAAVINGSNNPQNPLYLNQPGVDSLQMVAANVMNTMVTVGLAAGSVVQTEFTGPQLSAALASGTYAGQAVVNAVPFASYYAINPSQYAQGIYGGLTVTYVPLLGFDHINFGIVVSEIVAP